MTLLPVATLPVNVILVMSGYSVIRNSVIRKFCYKEHVGTAKSINFLFKSILL